MTDDELPPEGKPRPTPREVIAAKFAANRKAAKATEVATGLFKSAQSKFKETAAGFSEGWTSGAEAPAPPAESSSAGPAAQPDAPAADEPAEEPQARPAEEKAEETAEEPMPGAGETADKPAPPASDQPAVEPRRRPRPGPGRGATGRD